MEFLQVRGVQKQTFFSNFAFKTFCKLQNLLMKRTARFNSLLAAIDEKLRTKLEFLINLRDYKHTFVGRQQKKSRASSKIFAHR